MSDRALLRHTLATLAYRAEKPLRDAPAEFFTFRASEKTRTPADILGHMCDLFDWALSMANGATKWRELRSPSWEEERARFFAALAAFDARLADDTPLGCPIEQLFQGPIADALTHTGQLSLLRRMAGAPVRGENYAKAEIISGRVGTQQSGKRVEFD